MLKMMLVIIRVLDVGILVVIIISVEEGNVYIIYDYEGSMFDLYNCGVILGKDYDSKKVWMKLMVFLVL